MPNSKMKGDIKRICKETTSCRDSAKSEPHNRKCKCPILK